MLQYSGGTSEDKHGKKLLNWYLKQVNSDREIINYCNIIGIYKDFIIKGVIIYNNYNGSNIDIHAHMPGCFTKKTLRYMFDYPFNQIIVNRVTARPSHKNEKIINIIRRLGFMYEDTKKDYYGIGDHAEYYVITRDLVEKWIK